MLREPWRNRTTAAFEGVKVMLKGILLIVAMGVCTIANGTEDELFSAEWRVSGHDFANSRSQPAEVRIGPANVGKLALKWSFTTGADVSATPTVADEAIFFPDWAGNLYAVNRNTGQLLWSHTISHYDGSTGALSRTSPAIHGKDIIIGDIEVRFAFHKGASIIAIDRKTGALHWITRVDTHTTAQITGSPVVFRDIIYVGVSSQEEAFALAPLFGVSYPCCTFRGSVVALDANTGKLLWKTYTVPDNGGVPGGYSGGPVWQPPAIDPARGQLYVGTGNNYSAPDSVLQCEKQALANNHPGVFCATPDDHFDTALALDLLDGHIRWSKHLLNYDVWTVPCITAGGESLCPSPAGPDYDLGGSGPNLLHSGIVGFGQKSGMYWALDPDNGDIRWSTQVGPGGGTGGIQWGTATDGRRVYAAISNSSFKPYILFPSGQPINWGSWSALDPFTGKLLWQTADPTSGATDAGAVTVANGVLYAGSSSGFMYALEAATGKILWSFDSGGSVVDGPSIVDGVLYWGSGYSEATPGTGNNKLYAFSLPPRARAKTSSTLQ
jgi:polyvinyl alcohol dehydrogenase (cytochrome)